MKPSQSRGIKAKPSQNITRPSCLKTLAGQPSVTGNLRAPGDWSDSSIREKRSRRKASLASHAATSTATDHRVDESQGWEAIGDELAEVGKALRVTLDHPPEGFTYVTDDEYKTFFETICTYGIDECHVYMGPESRVAIPEDSRDTEFVEGQRREDIWSAVLERQAANDEPLAYCRDSGRNNGDELRDVIVVVTVRRSAVKIMYCVHLIQSAQRKALAFVEVADSTRAKIRETHAW
ncbi:hypothetical protein C8J57DRAFT_1252317 [Mycena rebaudengoi]|nr:hypothetical protein C8J57DRAFT_1252317 [Mycena rebaudengoi]